MLWFILCALTQDSIAGGKKKAEDEPAKTEAQVEAPVQAAAPSGAELPICKPANSEDELLTQKEREMYLRDFQKAQTVAVSGLEHKLKIELEEFKSVQEFKEKEFYKKQAELIEDERLLAQKKDPKKKFEPPKELKLQSEFFRDISADELAKLENIPKRKIQVFKAMQELRKKKFDELVELKKRPPNALWPAGTAPAF